MKEWNDCTVEQKIERWQQCARVLSELTPHERRKHFGMSGWGFRNECGTVACAAGHCGLDPWFRRRGFMLNLIYLRDVRETGTNYEKGERLATAPYDFSYLAVKFFGSRGQRNIFCGDGRTVSEVIQQIKFHIRGMKSATADNAWVLE